MQSNQTLHAMFLLQRVHIVNNAALYIIWSKMYKYLKHDFFVKKYLTILYMLLWNTYIYIFFLLQTIGKTYILSI